jgi:hypothetical protein
MALLSIGSIDLWDDAFSGFAYPAHKRVVQLLGDGTAAGNSVLMSGSLGYREAKVSFTAPDSEQRDLVRGWEETSETLTFIDNRGATRDVRVLAYEAALLFGDVWRVSITLQELTAPIPPGS